jgi:hypothetical protein
MFERSYNNHRPPAISTNQRWKNPYDLGSSSSGPGPIFLEDSVKDLKSADNQGYQAFLQKPHFNEEKSQ